jgi:hypothetical protein
MDAADNLQDKVQQVAASVGEAIEGLRNKDS